MKRFALVAALCSVNPLALAGNVNVQDLLKRSVANTAHNWKEAPNFVFTEHDVEEKLDSHGQVKTRTDKTFEVSMIDGSPYKKLVAVNGRPLSRQQLKVEDQIMEAEREHRLRESRSAQARRIAKYEKERRQNQAMLREMAEAFDYKLAGEQLVNGRATYVLDASPKPGYVPKSHDAKVLTGMKGKLFIDKADTQWVKVEVEVIHAVSFYAVATVAPGTKFEFEQAPVDGGVWMAKHFSTHVNSSVFFVAHNSNDDETYTNYRRAAGDAAQVKPGSGQAR